MSLAMSSKCKPVVGSSNKNNVPFFAIGCRLELPLLAASAKKPANLRRCDSPPDRVGTGCPSFTYSKPTSTIGCKARMTSRSAANNFAASLTVKFRISATLRYLPWRSICTSRISGRYRNPLQSWQRKYTSLKNCISMCSKPEPPHKAQRPSPLLKLNLDVV